MRQSPAISRLSQLICAASREACVELALQSQGLCAKNGPLLRAGPIIIARRYIYGIVLDSVPTRSPRRPAGTTSTRPDTRWCSASAAAWIALTQLGVPPSRPGSFQHWPRVAPLLPRPSERLEASDYVEQFFVDTALALLMGSGVELFQEVVDVLVGPLHGR